MRFPVSQFIPLDEYFKGKSLLQRVPNDRLIEDVDKNFPFLTEDSIRKLIRSGLLPLYFCKLRGISIPNAFKEGNVGVLRGQDLLVFKSLQISSSEGPVENCYGPFLAFLKEIAGKYGGPDALSQLPRGLNMLVEYLELPEVIDDLVIYDPSLFPKMLTANMYVEIHRLLKEESRARGFSAVANDIMRFIEEKIPDFMYNCRNNALLRSYSGVHGVRSDLFKQHKIQIPGEFYGDEDHEKLLDNHGQELCEDAVFIRAMGNKDLSIYGKRSTGDGEVEKVPDEEFREILYQAADSVSEADVGPDVYRKIHDRKRAVMNLVSNRRREQRRLLQLLKDNGLLKDLDIDPKGPKNPSEKLKPIFSSVVIDTHRHGITHAVQAENSHLVDRLPVANQKSLEQDPYDIDDVVDLFQHKCSQYLTVAVRSMHAKHLWHMLNLETRFPIPDIYLPGPYLP